MRQIKNFMKSKSSWRCGNPKECITPMSWKCNNELCWCGGNGWWGEPIIPNRWMAWGMSSDMGDIWTINLFQASPFSDDYIWIAILTDDGTWDHFTSVTAGWKYLDMWQWDKMKELFESLDAECIEKLFQIEYDWDTYQRYGTLDDWYEESTYASFWKISSQIYNMMLTCFNTEEWDDVPWDSLEDELRNLCADETEGIITIDCAPRIYAEDYLCSFIRETLESMDADEFIDSYCQVTYDEWGQKIVSCDCAECPETELWYLLLENIPNPYEPWMEFNFYFEPVSEISRDIKPYQGTFDEEKLWYWKLPCMSKPIYADICTSMSIETNAETGDSTIVVWECAMNPERWNNEEIWN